MMVGYFIMRNVIFTKFSQQILRDRLLFAVVNGKKMNLSCGFK